MMRFKSMFNKSFKNMSQTTNSTIPEIIIHVAPDNKAEPVNIVRKDENENIVYSKI